jgi:hypothetical protein
MQLGKVETLYSVEYIRMKVHNEEDRNLFLPGIMKVISRSQYPSRLRQVLSSVARMLRSQVRILLGAWMCVCVSLCCVVLCVGRGLASGRSPVQGVLPIVYRFTSKNPSTPQGKRGRLRKEERLRRWLNRNRWDGWGRFHAGGNEKCLHLDR